MADVLEEHDDAVGRELDRSRQRLRITFANTPALDWLILTKRPQNYRRLVPPEILTLADMWPGATVEIAEYSWRADALLGLACAGPR
jgi:hypothetical protein